MTQNRRRSERVPVGFYIDQIVDDATVRCFTTDMSAIGLYMERLAKPLERRSNMVQLEIKLPNTDAPLWAQAEVVYDRFDALFHGTAVRFRAMARREQRLLRDWLRDAARADRFAAVHPFRRAEVRIQRPSKERNATTRHGMACASASCPAFP